MRNPVVNILIPYVFFILLFENQVFGNALIVKFFILYVILKFFISSYFLVRKNKVILLVVFEILLFLNLFENYNFRILQILEDIPKREILLDIKIKKTYTELELKTELKLKAKSTTYQKTIRLLFLDLMKWVKV